MGTSTSRTFTTVGRERNEMVTGGAPGGGARPSAAVPGEKQGPEVRKGCWQPLLCPSQGCK